MAIEEVWMTPAPLCCDVGRDTNDMANRSSALRSPIRMPTPSTVVCSPYPLQADDSNLYDVNS